jgi:mannitol-1-phosphate/altronate dehydrogenase
MRKLWVHNMAHAMIGYLGHFAGYQLVWEAVQDERIARITKQTMRAIGHELYRRWSYQEEGYADIKEYIEWRWTRYGNRDLNDTVSRLCRDPIRKLGRDDRLLGAANYIRKYASPGEETDAELVNLLVGVVAAIRYAESTPGEGRNKLRADVLQNLVNIDSALLVQAEKRFEEILKEFAGRQRFVAKPVPGPRTS